MAGLVPAIHVLLDCREKAARADIRARDKRLNADVICFCGVPQRSMIERPIEPVEKGIRATAICNPPAVSQSKIANLNPLSPPFAR